MLRYLFAIALLFLLCCRQKSPETTLFELQENTGIHFSNNVQNTSEFNIFSYRNFYNGAGVAIGDLNNDGLADIFFAANMGSNKLYLNKGNWKFDDITRSSGLEKTGDWNTGVVLADVNHDGWLDIYVCNAGYVNGAAPQNKLYINNHNLTFTDSATEYGLTNKGGYCTHAAFFDYDLDGDLDCFIINNSFIPVNTLNYANKRDLRAKDWPVADFLKGGGDRLLRNDGNKFVDVSAQSGIYGSLISFGLGVTVGDVNNDGYPDVYVSNDFFERDYLYINQKNGTFRDELEQWMQHTSMSSMGADMADINNDGYPDIFVTDMLPREDYRLKTTTSFESIDVYHLKEKSGFYHQFTQNTLQVNNKDGKFVEAGYYAGVAASDWSWGGLIFDADNDGLSDIYVCNGIYHDVTNQDFIDFFANDVIQKMVLTGDKGQVDEVIGKMPSDPLANKAFKNMGNLQFSDVGDRWGFRQKSFSNGAAYGDLDNDGDLDLVVNNVNEECFVYRNNSRERNSNNYIAFLLQGTNLNTRAVGSLIRVYQGDQILSREIVPTRGFQSSVDYKAVIGLGKKEADSVIITWPNHSITKMYKPAINKLYNVKQDGQKAEDTSASTTRSATWLHQMASPFDKHVEDNFVDFYTERNIPMMVSREGPHATVGDVNGDGLADVYIAGANQQGGQLYLQTPGGFVKKNEPAFQQHADCEDVAVLFFDSDNDGDLDLFVGSGGNNHPPNSKQLLHRLFKNDGKGNFTLDSTAFPPNSMNIAVAIDYDFDNDGDKDLFVGARSAPYNYGAVPTSYLYVNDGTGKFTDVAKSKSSALASAGLLTGAVWADITGDKQKELVVVGEWMPPRIFQFTNGNVTELKTNLDSLFGWWQAVAAADLDGDGDEDLVLGNFGENFYLRPDAANPVKLWINDFDQNGSVEKILTRTIADRDVPVFLKRDLTDQVVSLKKQNLRYSEFAKKSIQELFPANKIKTSIVQLFNFPSSVIAYNEGNGKFTIRKMPVDVQLSCVNAIHCMDINGDGKPDVVMGGNKFGFLPQFSRLDASFGHMLVNKGQGNFDYLSADRSGLELRGEIRDIQEIPGRNKKYLLILQNDDFPALYGVQQNAPVQFSSTGRN